MECVIRVLLVDKSVEDIPALKSLLSKDGYSMCYEVVDNENQMAALLKQKSWDMVLFSNDLPQFPVTSGIKITKEINPDLPFVVISSKPDEDSIVCAMKMGASDFVIREKYGRLLSVVRREIDDFQLKLRKRSNEMLLAKSEERYRSIIDSITDVLFVLDNNLRCIFWNKAAEKFTGISIKSALSRPFYELFPENPGLEIQDMLQSVIENPKTTVSSFIISKDDKDCQYEICVYPVNNSLTIIIKEITQYLFNQDLIHPDSDAANQLTQSQKLRILGLLTSGVAHEVRNPLNAISVVLEALFQELGDNPDYLLYKDHVFTHVERLTRLMQDLLELGKPIERKKVVIINFADLVRESVALWRSSGNHCGHNVEIQMEFIEEMKIKGDPLKLQQVFMNILENASQHSPKGTVITIQVYRNNKFLHVKICDQGSGIKDEYLNRMFEPFFTTRKKGTGLGLAIVKHIVEVHGGTILIGNNDPGPGCAVDIEIPLYQIKKLIKTPYYEIVAA